MNTKINEILQEIESVIVGKNEIVEKILMAILAQGHVLMEDVPGVGKTTTAMTFAKVLGLETRRVQFTSDTVPSDLIGFLVYDKNDNPRGELFIVFVGVMGAIGLVSFWLLRRMTTERLAPAVASEKQKFNYFATLKSFFKNKPMMGATISTVAYLALMMTVTTSMPYVFMCYFQNTKLITIASMLAGCPIALGIVLAKPMLKKFSKKQLCTYPFLLSALSAGIAAFVRIKNPYVWIALVAVSMFGAAFYLTLMWALVADCIDYQEQKTGRREESSIYATYSLFRKIAQGVGAAVVSYAIGATGYNQNLGALEQAPGVPEKIYFVTAFLPFIGAIISFLSMLFLYTLDDNAQENGKDGKDKKEKTQE